MSVTLIAYPTADYTTDLQAWNAFNDRADADGATSREDACFGCLFSTFATLYDQPELAYVLDTMGEIDIALTFSVEDIADITKRRGSFSKTITLPNTPTNRDCFGHAYNIQSFVGGFQPNKKIRAAMWEDGVQVFSGVLQLISMSKIRGEVTYEVGLFSDDVSLFKSIEGNLLATTVGVSGMNHTLTSAHVSATWTASGASGYVYGLVDSYGYTDVVTQGWFAVPVYKMTPSIYVKKMVDLIFAQAGYRYTSEFFNSERFGKLVIPYAAGQLALNLSGSAIFVASTGAVTGATNQNLTMRFQDETGTYYDRPGYWVPSSSTFVAPAVPTRWNITVTYSLQLVGAGSNTARFNMSVRDLTNSTDNAVITGLQLPLDASGNTQVNATIFSNVTIPANTTANIGFVFTNPAGAGTIFSGATVLWECLENPAASFIDMRTALPADVKQSDLLQDLQKMFNLYFMPDPADPKNLIVEPWVDFYSSGVVDWSQKSDENAEQNITNGDPNQYKTIVFKYKDAGDYLSKLDKSNYPLAKEGYGGRIFTTDNFYGKGENIVELACSTLIPANFTTDKVIGRAWDLDGSALSGTIKTLQSGYRIAQYNLIEAPTTWAYQYGVSGSVALAESLLSLPFVSHLNNPYAADFDLAFGIPKQLYYAVNVAANSDPYAYTNNNLFNIYWWNFIQETVSREAMQLELSIMLNAVDISQLDFRTPIYYGGVRWRLLEIRDYEIGQQKPCRITLRRILNLTEFAPKQIYYFPYDGPVPATDSDYPNEVPPIPTIKELPAVAGPQGETGAAGAQGDPGPAGEGFTPGDAAGDIKYWDGSDWVNLGIGTEGQVLEVASGIPSWQDK
jgi:hypothetical protein